MEVKPFILIDACTFINFVHIDDSNYLIDQLLRKLNVKICEEVFKEIKDNIYYKYRDESKKILLEDSTRKNIELAINNVRSHQYSDTKIKEDYLGENDIYEDFETYCTHHKINIKPNGEYHSTCLALFLSRLSKMKVDFYTDDTPAREEFSPVFNFHQIGQVHDGIDLLFYLYWVINDSNKFNRTHLKKYLLNIKAEYTLLIQRSLEVIRNYDNNLKGSSKSERDYKILLKKIAEALDTSDFKTLEEKIPLMKRGKIKKNHSSLIEYLQGISFFEKITSSNIPSIISKIEVTVERIDSDILPYTHSI